MIWAFKFRICMYLASFLNFYDIALKAMHCLLALRRNTIIFDSGIIDVPSYNKYIHRIKRQYSEKIKRHTYMYSIFEETGFAI